MRRKGVEPSRLKKHMRLKHACLPFHHLRSDSIIILQVSKNSRKSKGIVLRACFGSEMLLVLWYNKAIKRMRSSLARKNYQSTSRFLLCRA